MTGHSAAVFHKSRHIKYFLRCLKTFLPAAYTSADSSRMLLAFFIVAGLDLLGALQDETTLDERNGYIEWIYHCQLPSGGFRGFTGTDFGLGIRSNENMIWDPATIPSTFFAIVTLVILGDDLVRLRRRECLEWLPRVQREDGSFGEVLGPDGKIEGGRDLRFCCCAAGTRYLLRGKDGSALQDVQDIDVGKLMSFIQDCQSYDGGLSEAPFCESHSGLTYCAIGALNLLSRTSKGATSPRPLSPASPGFEPLVRWLVARQTSELDDGLLPDNEVMHTHEKEEALRVSAQESSINDKIDQLPSIQPPNDASLQWAGFNGRCNKVADTCYSFWNTAALAMVDRLSLIDAERDRKYLLEKAQHSTGGFSKGVGEPPDLLHSYFGMVALALRDESGLESVDPALCATERAIQHLESLLWWQTTSD